MSLLWQNAPQSDDRTPDVVGVIGLDETARRVAAGFLFEQSGVVPGIDDTSNTIPNINYDVQNILSDIARKLAGLTQLIIDGETTASTDNGFHIGIVTDPTNPGHFTVDLQVPTSNTGIPGPKGDKGDTGAAGTNGTNGATGAKGDKGDKGDTGNTGATGATGADGATGATGPKGDKGDKGDTGATGAAGTCPADCTVPDAIKIPDAGSASQTKCNSAASVSAAIKVIITTATNTGATVSGIVAAIGALILSIATLGAFALAIVAAGTFAAGIGALGAAPYLALFTDAVLADLTCIIVAHAQEDGTYTDADVASILSDIAAKTAWAGYIADAFTTNIQALGARGLTQAHLLTPSVTGNCSACPSFWNETFTIPVDGTRKTTTHSTIVGHSYSVRISGTCIVYNRGDGFYVQGDAYWRESNPGTWDLNDVRVQVDDVNLSPIQAFSSGHVYNLVLPGTGHPLSFAEVGAGLAGNPSGTLTVSVTGE